jgi:hypothetical protein
LAIVSLGLYCDHDTSLQLLHHQMIQSLLHYIISRIPCKYVTDALS